MKIKNDDKKWSSFLQISFRFVFVYFLLYSSFIIFSLLSITNSVMDWLRDSLVAWTAKYIVHVLIQIPNELSGSGDTTYDYILVLSFILLSGAATLLWSVLDSKRPNYNPLNRWLRVLIRLTLGIMMISYGAAKVIPTQFPPLELVQLVSPYGDSSPMGILWKFMQTSQPYTIFTGVLEMVGGILLMVPSLTLLGACISFAIMTNVFVLNMCYDVPVKLFSCHLLLMSILLILPDLRRLSYLFVFNRPIEPSNNWNLFKSTWLNQSALVLQLVFGIYLIHSELQQNKMYFLTDNAPFYGIWKVEEFHMGDELRPPLLSDRMRWNQVIFSSSMGIEIQMMDNSFGYFGTEFNKDTNTFSLGKFTDPQFKSEFAVEKIADARIMVAGTVDGQKIQAKLTKIDENEFLLKKRGFHWINEQPFNLTYKIQSEPTVEKSP